MKKDELLYSCPNCEKGLILKNPDGSQNCESCGLWWGSEKEFVAKEQQLSPLPAEDMVNHPPHYKSHPSGIECIEITRHMNFNVGNAVKYLWRFDKKENAIQDLKKAIWYLQDEITRLELEEAHLRQLEINKTL